VSNAPLDNIEKVRKSLKRRYRFEKIFQAFGIFSICIGLASLLLLLADNIYKGHKAFVQNYIELTIVFDATELGITDVNDKEQIKAADYTAVIRNALKLRFPDVTERTDKKKLFTLLSGVNEYDLKKMVVEKPSLIGQTREIWLMAGDDVDTYLKHFVGHEDQFSGLNSKQLEWLHALQSDGKVRTQWNHLFFTAGDSREPEQAGIRSALMGSFYTLLVTLLLSFPLGVAAAIYLEEFSPKNRWTDFIEVNVNNLAAVPSIIFGLLGLAVFINFFGVPRSVPLVGGLVLTLMTLPTIIISSRAAIKSVPPSIREAALGIGASKMQTVMHHVLPLSMPGMLTGAIIGMARALGESAPLLMIGMVAFIVNVPGGVTDSATVLPVQIYLWSDNPERSFTEKTSAAILVLLVFLVAMNAVAIYLRNRMEKRW